MRGSSGKVAARVLALGIAVAGIGTAPAAAADPAVSGQWGPLQQYPVVPVSMGVMPDGKIVAWDQANKPPNFGPVPNNGAAMILDPATGQITRSNNVAPRSTFCSLIATLPDGRLAIIGGGIDSGSQATADVQIYDEDSKTFSTLGMMNAKRWYPGGTLDRNGNPIVAGGSSRGIERFDQLTGASTFLDQTFPTNWYPDLIRTADGRFVIEDVGDNATAGPGRFMLTASGLQSVSDRSLLQTRRRGIRTMVGPYRMFYNSGGTSTASLMIDATSGTPRYTQMASSRYPHMTGQAVTLPTGDVLAVGGNSSGNDTKGTPVMTPEIYSVAQNRWTSMETMERRRTYHSVAALLPDGRVWSAGSSFDEVQEPNGQFFSPPYLFRNDGSGQLAARPTATDAPASVGAGQPFSVATNNPSNIASASFIRMAGTTHQLNAGQAFVPLSVTASGGRVQMTAPSVDEAPPGDYMLFLVDRQGVPSVAPIIRLQATANAAPQPRVTQSSQYSQLTPAWNAFNGDNSGNGEAKVSHTLDEAQPWWQVDLGESRDLDSLTIRMRTDCCTDRTKDLWVFASDVPFQSTNPDTLRQQQGVTAVRLQTPSGTINTANLDRTARYIRIQRPDSGFLSLAEVTPNENRGPTVGLTAPTAGQTYTAPATYTISANASDTDGTIQKVEFFRGQTLVGTDASAPYSVSDANVPAGSYSLTAKATDSSGATATSSPVQITVSSPPASTGPVAAYAFDEGTGATTKDETGNGHSGSISGATWATGRSGKALSFDGVDDAVSVADHNRLDFTNSFTIESWVRPDVDSGWHTVVLKEAPPSSLAYGLYGSSGGAGQPSAWTSSGAVQGPAATPAGAWTHLATTYDSGTFRIYVNGSLVATETGVPAPITTNGSLRIGGNSIWDFESFDGLIDDVRLYNRALSASEVVKDRDTPVATPPAGPKPVLELKFEEGTGTTAADTSGSSHPGTIAGATWTTSGHTGKALSFDGNDDMVTVADHNDLDLGSQFTIESWVRPRNSSGWQTVALKEAPSGLSYGLYSAGPVPSAWTAGGAVVGPGPLPSNTWSHLATTFDNGTMRMYVNGQLVSTETGVAAPVASTGALRIGANQVWGDEDFDGLIDDVRIWRQTLSPAQLGGGGLSAASVPAPKRKCVTGKWSGSGSKKLVCKKRKRK